MATILVVDDEPDILDVLRLTLENAGFDVLTATNGIEALDVVAHQVPDAMLLDIGMPQVDGWQVLERIKSSAEGDLANVPVVMVTAWTSDEDRVRGGIEGAVRYLGKPFNPAEVVDVLRDLLRPDAPSEPEERRRIQQSSLEHLARIESGSGPAAEGPRVHLTRLDRPHVASFDDERDLTPATLQRFLESLSPRQRAVAERVMAGVSVAEIAAASGVSRSNIYAILRRIAKRAQISDGRALIKRLRRLGEGDG